MNACCERVRNILVTFQSDSATVSFEYVFCACQDTFWLVFNLISITFGGPFCAAGPAQVAARAAGAGRAGAHLHARQRHLPRAGHSLALPQDPSERVHPHQGRSLLAVSGAGRQGNDLAIYMSVCMHEYYIISSLLVYMNIVCQE